MDISFHSPNKNCVEYINALPKKPAAPFEKLYPNANPQAIDLLRLMLKFDPRSRINADKALKHEYLAALHNVNDEPTAEPFDFNADESASHEVSPRTGLKPGVLPAARLTPPCTHTSRARAPLRGHRTS